MIAISVISLFLALILETSITTIPLIFLVLLCFMVIFKEDYLFGLAFLFGLMFDALTFKTLGISSLFFVIFLFLVLIYQRKFEITSNYFILASSFLGSLCFLFFSQQTENILLESILSSIIGLIFFNLIKSRKLKLKTAVNL